MGGSLQPWINCVNTTTSMQGGRLWGSDGIMGECVLRSHALQLLGVSNCAEGSPCLDHY